MFTGIVESLGRVKNRTAMGEDVRLHIETGGLDLAGSKDGDSILVSGVCLTMVQPGRQDFCADVSAETMALTTLGGIEAGQSVNLELALTLSSRLGGHLVTGHIDGLGRLIARIADGRAERFEFELPAPLKNYVARKGSISIDGVSLTVNEVRGKTFSVCLIPHTLEVTTLGKLQEGDAVNLEVDLVARYVELWRVRSEPDHDLEQ